MSPVEWLEHHFHHRSDEYLTRFRRPANRNIVEFHPLVSQKARWIWRSDMNPCVSCWLDTGDVVPDTREHIARRHPALPLSLAA
ncbi:hypothetical protein JQS43_10150 [Natronosporangium hydrolyticum]|uniref:Uncharacterized protein n=1 Tax=Natronosporangium hydrolyticum TaxID=2811111 RepID=A0A895YFK5_9ACTN|nr:hypothetical protein [Natronosporangium hydrolyticum]QSB16597.1 hypothetical protein JQS43_10150 [Natronosporangium hydrolyticum]